MPFPHLRRRVLAFVLAAASLLLVLPAAALGAADDDRLALTSSDVPALTPAGGSAGAARAALQSALPRAVRATTRPARVEASSYREGKGAGATLVDVRAYVLPSTAAATRAQTALRRALRKPGKAAIGVPASIAARRVKGRSDVQVVLRSGAAVATLRLRTTSALPKARALALELARLEGQRLRRALSRTRWERVLDGVRPDGSVPPKTLLQLTELLYGDVKGVTLPAGRAKVPVTDGTGLIEGLLTAKLTKAQKAAVEAAWATPRKGPKVREPRGTKGVCNPTSAGMPLDAGLTSLAIGLRDAQVARIPGSTKAWTVCVYKSANPSKNGANVGADTIQWNTESDKAPYSGSTWDAIDFLYFTRFDECYIRVFPKYFTLSPVNQAWAMAHEMYHCVHKEGVAGDPDRKNPMWAEEGLADWTAQQVSPGTYEPHTEYPGSHYDGWHWSWAKQLFTRSYDTFGFWGRIEEEAGAATLLSRLTGVWAVDTDSPTIFAVTTGSNQPDVLNSWGSGHFNQAGWAPKWLQKLPFTVPDTLGPDYYKPIITLGSVTERLKTTDHRADMYVLRASDAPLVQVTVEGNGRVTDGTTEWLQPSGVWMCLGGGCECPPGQEERTPIPAHADIGASLYAGMAAGAGTSTLVLEPHRLSEYCGPKPPEPSELGDAGPSGGGGSNGDPHLTTFDGARFDFQAAGEFVLARGPGFEVQARQEPWQESKTVSVNTMFGFRVGSARVTVEAGSDLVVRVGGKKVSAAKRTALAGGGYIAPAAATDRCSGLVLRWADGSAACIWSVGRWGVAMNLQPAAARAGALAGLLGNFDGQRANDFATRGGKVLDAELVTGYSAASFTSLYRVLGVSWRVSAADTLLDYEAGQTPATFLKPKFPSRFVTVESLTAAQRAKAEARCRELGVTDLDLLEDCILDLAVTGEDAFGEAAALEEDVAFSETAWTSLAGVEHLVQEPSIAASADGVLHVAVATSPTNDRASGGAYGRTTIGPDGVQGGLELFVPAGIVEQPVLFRTGSPPALIGDVWSWPAGTQPPGVATKGVMRWGTTVFDHLPGRDSEPTFALEVGGVPFTITRSAGGGHMTLHRGSGAGFTSVEWPTAADCYDVDGALATDGAQLMTAWLEWDCGEGPTYGWFTGTVDPATGAIGGRAHVPMPDGATQPLYDLLGEPAAFVYRPVTGGYWIAYTLDVPRTGGGTDVRHAFLYRMGDATATDLGPIPATEATLQLAATPSGALWIGWFDVTRRDDRLLLRLRRIAPGGTTFEAGTRTLTWPSLDGREPFRRQIAVATRGEALDVVVFDTAQGARNGAIWHTRVD